jgi:hypothetical protein
MISSRCAIALGALLLAACSSAAEPKSPTWTSYPKRLHGNWMPQDMECPVPLNHDSDALVVISEKILNNYEESSKPIRVTAIKPGPAPAVWSIDSYLNVAGDGYDTKITEIFLVTGDQLVIADKERARTYHRCK